MLPQIKNGAFIYHNKLKLSYAQRSLTPPSSLLTKHSIGLFTSRENNKIKLG